MGTILTVIVTAGTVAALLYVRIIRPLRQQRARLTRELDEVTFELSEERRLRADVIKWIEIECFKFKFIEKALKQRVDERLAALRELREQRRRLLIQ